MKVHFKRHGSADWLELKGLKKNTPYYIEHKGGYLHMEKIVDSQRVKEKSVRVDFEEWKTIENEIYTFSGLKVKLGQFVESYHIPQHDHPEDRDILNGKDITGMRTREVIAKTGIKLDEFFISWMLPDSVYNSLQQPNEKILSMKFKELYALIHWNCHKRDFEKTYQSAIIGG